jgi:hypothetical protein
MKTVITLITLLTVISIGSISFAESKTTNAAEQAVQDEHVKTDPNPVPVISTEEDADVFAFYSDDGC